jgi:carboxypeptidase family protein
VPVPVLLLLVLAPPGAGAAARVSGTVHTVLRPLAGVHVDLPALGAFATTDSAGRFVLPAVPAGAHAIELAAVGYAPVHAAIVVSPRADSTGEDVDAGPWMLTPLRPDERPLGFRAPAPVPAPIELSAAEPIPLAGHVGFFRTKAEEARWPSPAELRPASRPPLTTAEAFADLLRRIAVADSITTATGGTGAPGFETWRQWGDRLAVFAGDSARALEPRLLPDSSLVLRAVAYARSRAAVAAGRTTAGYRLAADARSAVRRARLAGPGEGEAFLADLEAELDASFVPGSSPPKAPKRVPAKKKRHRR